MNVDEIIQEIEREIPNDGSNPTDNPLYMGDPCPYCHRPEATALAWDELDEEEGTNLCWGGCRQRRSTYTFAEVLSLVNEIKRLREKARQYEEASA